MRDDRERLLDIIEAIDRILRRTQAGQDALADDELIQIWVIHHIEIIGEAARGVSPAVRERSPEVPWRGIVAMRNILSHRYFGSDVERVWTTVERDLPTLRAQLDAIVAGMDTG